MILKMDVEGEPSMPREYKSSLGITFWMDLKGDEREFSAPTIRTSDPEISVVIVPNNQSIEDVYLFNFKGKRFAFSKPSQRARLHSDIFSELSERNPDLDMVFTNVGQPEVRWHNPIARVAGDQLLAESFNLEAESDLGDPTDFEAMSAVFFELVQWMGGGATAMARGSHQNENIPFSPVRAGLDVAFLSERFGGGESNG